MCLLNSAYLSETSRMQLIHDALRAQGVDSVLATHGGSHEHVLADAGCEYELLTPIVSATRSRELVAAGPGMGSARQSMWSDDEIRTTALAEADYFRSVRATAVVTGFQLTTLISARLAGIPLITSHAGSWVAPIMQRGLVPTPQRTAPGWVRRVPRPMQRFLANGGALQYRGHIGGFNRVARELGVDSIPSLPALLSGDLTLVTEAPELLEMTATDFEDWRPPRKGMRASTRMRAVGPVFARLPMPVPAAVDAFLDAPGDVAYVSFTSTSADVVDRATAAVRAAGLRALVATTLHEAGSDHDENVLRVPFLPSHLIMPRVRLAVVTGGQGSVQTALAAGTPLVGIPLQPEQEWNVAVAQRAGAARAAFLPDLDETLPAAVRGLVADDHATLSAQRVARIYANHDGAAAAARAITEYLAEPVLTRG